MVLGETQGGGASTVLHAHHNRAAVLNQLLNTYADASADRGAGLAAQGEVALREVWARKAEQSRGAASKLHDELIAAHRTAQMAAQGKLASAARERRAVVRRMVARRDERRAAAHAAGTDEAVHGLPDAPWWRAWLQAYGKRHASTDSETRPSLVTYAKCSSLSGWPRPIKKDPSNRS